MRLAYLLNSDKSITLFAITGNILPEAGVKLSFNPKFLAKEPKASPMPFVSCVSAAMWALDEQGVVLRSLASIIADLEEDDRTPLKILAAIDTAKGKQVCQDATGALRCVDTMRDDETVYIAKDLKELSAAVDTNNEDESKMHDAARVAIKRQAAALLMSDDIKPDLFDRITLWSKAGSKIVKASDGKKPTFLDKATLFK